MNDNLQLEIVTPFGKTITEEISSCVVPGVKGQFQVLKNHAAVISNIAVGAIKVKNIEKNEIFIATIGEGIFIYNKTTGLSKSLRSIGPKFKELANLLDESQIYNGTQLSNGDYALATLNNGCIVFNSAGDIIYKLDKENGLQDFVVINLYETLDGNLWMALNKGISYAEISTPFTKLGNEYGLEGIILDVKRYNDILFVATNIGAYFLDYDENNLPIFRNIPIDNRLVWQIEEFKVPNSDESKLLFATDYYVREYIPNKEPKLVSSIEYNCRFIYQSRFKNERLYVGYSPGLALIEFKNGKWIDKGKQYEISDEIRTIVEDEYGNLWLGTSLKGIIRINLDETICFLFHSLRP